MTSSEANIFDRKMLKTGKTTPEARAAMVPTAKRGILSLEYAKILLKMALSYFFTSSFCTFFSFSSLVSNICSSSSYFRLYFLEDCFLIICSFLNSSSSSLTS